ncbi:hypothetical protein [Paraburkholderia ultramafica]
MPGGTENESRLPACVWPVNAEPGEGSLWQAAENAVYFVDIKGRNIGINNGTYALGACLLVSCVLILLVPRSMLTRAASANDSKSGAQTARAAGTQAI